ncbi:RmuC domain protein [Neisseria bacilliformis ATCC BAA-1200]|uniref:RmuC domain protein n=1 Tax=Neisseria bacilliformis ATCC BAA-1200 TaxID=888742 RepID=F2BA84_9NEIS|nr:DNA recombination protein RmuC [Neisseria bacilliformis]EGF11544.1 RmuC domain protein [Neisseria bacilliformis ATCC BAA-1200]QMT47861.1 DNA recombination protein RmuC [Neisseria bacilliformis]
MRLESLFIILSAAAALIAAVLSAIITALVCRNRHQADTAELARRHQAEQAESESRCAALEENRAHLETLCNRLTAEQRRSEEELSAQIRLSDGLRGRLNAAENELAAANVHARRLSELQDELAAGRSTANELHGQIRELDSRRAALETQVRHLAVQADELGRLKTESAALQKELADARVQNERLATQAEESSALKNSYAAELGRLKTDCAALQKELADARVQNRHLATRIEQEQQAQQEKLALLNEARDALGSRFQNLANQILEEKSRRFSEQNREQLGILLNPLSEKLGGFSQLVQNTYEKEAKERLTLENELKRLQQLNSRLHEDAAALTRALTGSRNKTQGNWGEMILESVLEHSGLQKGREYTVQAASVQTQDDGSKRRLQPDVLVNLPDGKQIVIDSKVSLTDYVRYTQAQNDDEARAHLAAHVQSVRRHIAQLAEKKYSDIDGLKTLDFVFMFIPVEPAYLLALQQDESLFQECFDKRIMPAGPSTLLATLRTVANIWRNEQQNRNALAIAEEGGRLYDKFAGFVETLQSVGKNIEQAQTAYHKALGQLKDGRGNLITRAQKLHKLGVKAGKQIDRNLLEEAEENETAALIAADKTEDTQE